MRPTPVADARAGRSAPTRYDAFISYSHTADDRLAPRLQDGLQRLAKPWWRRRALRVFRDTTGLSANPNLWSSIESAIDDSEWFVLLASPESAASAWVEREVAHWLSSRGPDRLLAVVTDGTWQWDRELGDFDPDSTAVPMVLRGAFDDEPRHIDLSWARSEQQLDLRNGRFRDQVAEIAAPLHGLAKDDLEGVDLREHRRTLRWVWGAAVLLLALVVAAATAGAVAMGNAARADKASDEAGRRAADAEYGRLVAEARNQVGVDRDLSFLLALEANRLRDEPESRSALLAALQAERNYLGSISTGDRIWSVAKLDDSKVVYGTRDSKVTIVDLDTGTTSTPTRIGDGAAGVIVAEDPSRSDTDPIVAARADTGEVWRLDPRTLKPLAPPFSTGGPLFCLAASQRLGLLAACSDNGTVPVLDLSTGETRATLPAGPNDTDPAAQAPRDEATDRFAAGGAQPGGDDATAAAFSPTDDRLAISRPGGWLEIWSTDGRRLHDVGGDTSVNRYTFGSLEFRPDGRALIEWSVDRSEAPIRSVDPETGSVQWQSDKFARAGFGVTAYSHDGGRLLVLPDGGRLVSLDAATGELLDDVADVPAFFSVGVLPRSNGDVVVLDADGGTLSTYSTDGRGRIVRVLGRPGMIPFGASPLGSRLVAWEGPGPLFFDNSLWDLDTGEEIISKLPVGRSVLFDDTTLVAFYDDLTASRFDLETGRRIPPEIPFDPAAVTWFSWNQRAGLFAIGYPDRVDLIDVVNGRRIDLPDSFDGGSSFMSLSDDGTVAAVQSFTEAMVVDLRTGEAAIPTLTEVYVVKFDAGGNLVVSHTDGRLERVDLRTGRQVTLYPRQSQPSDIRVGESIVMSRRPDSTVLFDLSSGIQLGSEFPVEDSPFDLTSYVLSSGDRYLVLVGRNGMDVWDLRLDRWRDAACQLAGRNLTEAEWATYLPADEPYRATCPQY